MTLAYPLTLNHCQSLCSLGSLGNRNRSNITSPPICLALVREVHAVFMPVWDGFKLFSYQKAHSNILFERHCKPQILQPPFNHMSWFKRPESDLLPRRAVTVKEWDVIYHPQPHTHKRTRVHARGPDNQRERESLCWHTWKWRCTHVPTGHPFSHKYPTNTCSKTSLMCLWFDLFALLLHKLSVSWPRFSYGAKSDHMLFTDCSYITFHPGILSKHSLLNPPLTVSSLILCCCFFFPSLLRLCTGKHSWTLTPGVPLCLPQGALITKQLQSFSE